MGAAAGAASAVGSIFGSSTKGTGAADVALPETSARAALAMATEEYPATPGDVYKLIYLKVTQPDNLNLIIEGDGSINAGFLGRFSAKGLTFRQIKAQIEKKVADSYPGSNPSLVIVSTGLFPVTVRGEVLQSGLATVWGLSRLSEVIAGFSTDYSSLRDVTVVSRDGKSVSYDLFAARRRGDLTQDPYLKPGDVVEVKKAERSVRLQGEVRRPGKYQLLAKEGLKELVADYGDGTLESAKTDLVVVTRKATKEKPASESLVVDLSASSLPDLYDGDEIRIPSREEYLPVVYVEGAVGTALPTANVTVPAADKTLTKDATTALDKAAEIQTVAPAQSAGTDEYGSLRLAYRQGLLLSQAIKGLAGSLSPKADLRKAYVVKALSGAVASVDLEKLLYAYDMKDDIELAANDRMVIPYALRGAYVTGEVVKSAWVDVNSKTRLSEVLKNTLTPYSQKRAITVKGADGTEKTYDLFEADRKGDLSQDPMLRPGDIVTVGKVDRLVNMTGEVHRPGKYQLLDKEGLKELIADYGDGTLESAKTDLVVVTRKATKEKPASESLVVDLSASTLPDLYDGDEIRIPSREEYLPVVYVEGAVGTMPSAANVTVPAADKTIAKDTTAVPEKAAETPAAATAQSAGTDEYGSLRLAYRQGLLLSQAVKGLSGSLSPKADLRKAYVVKAPSGAVAPVDLEKLLYAYDAKDDLELKANDRVVIPYALRGAYVTGEVVRSAWVDVTGKTRLSEALKDNLTVYSQRRVVIVTSRDGTEKTFDLFIADRKGDLSQDPLLRAGDVITVGKAERLVSLSGEVRRSGTYRLLSGEGLKELVADYGDGALESAKTDLVVVTRKATKEKPTSESLVVDLSASSLPDLYDGDEIRVPSREEYLPIVYLEGAIGSLSKVKGDTAPDAVSKVQGTTSQVATNAQVKTAAASQETAAPAGQNDGYETLRLAYRQGLLLSQVFKGLAGSLSSKADLKKAYVVNASSGAVAPVDLEKLLYAYDAKDDIELKANDRVVIPFALQGAYITGEVVRSAWVDVNGKTRLSEALKDNLTIYSQRRVVKIASRDGTEKTFDLYIADRKSDLSQDPILRAGDIVTVGKAERQVSLSGEVRRSGTYRLLPSEGLKELVGGYGDGALESAKTDLVVVTRKATKERPKSESLVVDLSASSLPDLYDGDEIRVPSREEYLPIVYLEGAIGSLSKEKSVPVAELVSKIQGTTSQVATNAQIKPPASSQEVAASAGQSDEYETLRLAYRQGLLLSQVFKGLAGSLSPKADLRKAYVVSGPSGAVAPVDLEKLLYAYDAKDDVELKANDRVVIPYAVRGAYVTGEVAKSAWVDANGKARLSEALKDALTPYSQKRMVTVKGADGTEKTYDLFIADRKGDLTQDPLLRAGDIVTVGKAERLVNVTGEVRRPGKYQLMAKEGLKELVNYYGDGALESAKTDLVVVTRKATKEKPASESLVVDLSASTLPDLYDGDEIRIPSREEYLPVVYMEGATQASGYGMQRLLWRQGLLVSQALKPIVASIPPAADLRNARLLRAADGVELKLDLEKLLYAFDPAYDQALGAGDRIILPYGSRDAYITGEVVRSGFVPADGALRLSAAVKSLLTPASSTRAVAVKGADGKEAVYDLFKAERFGDASQDPVLVPGDTISIARAGRIVVLEGEVFRPGTYELLPGEGFGELLAALGGGLRGTARADMVQVTRKASSANAAGAVVLADARASAPASSLPALEDGDKVRVPSMDEYLPLVYVEGAVTGEYSVKKVAWRAGMRVADLIRPLRDGIPASADLKKAFIAKSSADAPVAVDLEKILYSYDPAFDVPLEPEDRLVIPLGSMYVFVTGEVQKSAWVTITGLTRLRDVVSPSLTRWSSTRDVAVASRNGLQQRYDLFRAERYGDLTQDPFLRPGDVVTVGRLDRVVTIAGEVRRPGSYQLLAGEGMKDLVERYADGFTEKGNPTRIQVVRYLSTSSAVGERLQFDYTATPGFALNQYDSITVPAWQDLLPVAWFEGAVGVGAGGAVLESAKRVPYTFFPGETVSEAAQAMRKNFSEVSDLAASYISRKGDRIAVDLTKYLYDRNTADGPVLEANDVIVVPFRQFFVTVSGAVRSPGRYPYVPDRTWGYYVNLAGGFDSDKNVNDKVTIYDMGAKKAQNKDRVIQPEDMIVADANSFVYNMLKITSILSTAISFVALVVSLLP
jgi:protein involved in polysaccharide export with SLBB domain